MLIQQLGLYKLLEDFTHKTTNEIKIIPKNTIIMIASSDREVRKLYVPELKDWHNCNLPVEKVYQ